jgi:hypothetical protein
MTVMTPKRIKDNSVAPSPDKQQEFAELWHHYGAIRDPDVRAAILHTMIMLPHLDKDTGMRLLDECLAAFREYYTAITKKKSS